MSSPFQESTTLIPEQLPKINAKTISIIKFLNIFILVIMLDKLNIIPTNIEFFLFNAFDILKINSAMFYLCFLWGIGFYLL